MTVTARIALPVGDPNGIGPEIALRAAAAYAGRRDVQLTLFGPEAVLQQTADRLGLAAVLQTAAVVATEAVAGDGYTPAGLRRSWRRHDRRREHSHHGGAVRRVRCCGGRAAP